MDPKYANLLKISFAISVVLVLFLGTTWLIYKNDQNKLDQYSCDRDKNGGKYAEVCKCSEQTCHQLMFEWPSEPMKTVHVRSSLSGSRFVVVTNETMSQTAQHLTIIVDTRVKLQKIMGFGGAFTDATGWHLANLSSTMADKLIASYYGQNGLGYTFGRVPMAGSDFSTRPYSYDDTPYNAPDYNLEHFALQPEDHELKIPFILKAKKLTESLGKELKLFASPWSPPAWMKTSNSFVNGTLIDEPKVYESYANYWTKFLDAYRQEGVTFWGATVQNEPYSGLVDKCDFNNLQMGAEQMSKFVTKYLGPMLDKFYHDDAKKLKLMVGDDNLRNSLEPVPRMFNTTDMDKYVSGLAFHWYQHKIISYDKLKELYDQVKHKIEFMLMTEACETEDVGRLGNWIHAENYASDIIEDLRRFTSGWVDWNMALDEQGGPNWVKNFVDSPVIVDSKEDVYYLQPMYHVLAHFSRFLLPDSVVVISTLKSYDPNSGVSFVASLNEKTNHLVVIVLNKSQEPKNIRLVPNIDAICDIATFQVEPKSISSFVVKLAQNIIKI